MRELNDDERDDAESKESISNVETSEEVMFVC